MADFRRFGRFTAPAELAHTFSTDLKRVMGKCIVFRAEHLFHTNKIEYMAASEHFRPVPLGEVVPEYRWIFSDTDGLRAEEVDAYGVAIPAAFSTAQVRAMAEECGVSGTVPALYRFAVAAAAAGVTGPDHQGKE
jgi:hypothetical protein